MDGTANGEFLFECEPNYGALLRPNQVKVIEGTDVRIFSHYYIFSLKTRSAKLPKKLNLDKVVLSEQKAV